MVAELLRKYEGVHFVYRQFPLDGMERPASANQGMCDEPADESPGPSRSMAESSATRTGATRAAIAAYCAGAQGRFWDYHHLLCARPDEAATCDGLVRLGREVGMDEKGFVDCLDDPVTRATVQQDFDAGVRAGLYGTPTFFVNGVELVAPSKDVLEGALTRALEARRP